MLYKILKDNRLFLLPYFILLLLLIPFFFIYTKGEMHLHVNQYHTAFFDWFFRHVTFMGDGLFVIVPAIILLFFSLRHFVLLACAYLGSGLITQILKRVFFEDMARPGRFLAGAQLHLVDGVDLLSGRSFPSGHSTSAFALFLCLALISKNKIFKITCFVLACLTAFSRVYLSQHFIMDIYAGSIIGTLTAIGFYYLFYSRERKWHAWNLTKIRKDEYSA
ncbi:MAG: phosphatase PAP2 family protein [Bacteroidales bacterium]|nr:phosphatase PAP2 family protein [Bacteroidales bacterium]